MRSALYPLVGERWVKGAAGHAVDGFGMFMVLPVLATYGMDLAGATPALIGLAIGAYGLTQAIFQIPFGIISDRIGRRPVIYLGLIVFALGSVIAAKPPTSS